MASRKVNLTLELPEEDLKDILFKVAADGTTLSELLEGFISDLVCGAHHGSDECDRAIAYYDRCCYGLGEEDTFLRYLLKFGEIEYYLDIMSNIQAYNEWLADGEDYSEELKEAKQEQDSIYKQWGKDMKNRHRAGKRHISKWKSGMKNIKNSWISAKGFQKVKV